jgi:hypothetical protein
MRAYCDETRNAFMNDWRLTAAGPSVNRESIKLRDRYLFEEVPVTLPVQVTATGTDEEPHHQSSSSPYKQVAMVKTTPTNPLGGAPSSLNSHIRLLASQYREPTRVPKGVSTVHEVTRWICSIAQ